MANKNILFILTSHDKLLSGKPSGWYLPEAAHPYYVLRDAGYNITFASPKGGKSPLDPNSVEQFKDDKQSQEFLNSKETQDLFNNTKKLSDVKEKDFAAIFYVGGHGPVMDLTTDENSIQLIQQFWTADKPVSAVCHAPTAFLNVYDMKNGEFFVKGKKVTCFSNAEEEQAGLVDEIPFLVESQLKGKGAHFVNNREPWGEEVVVDGKLVSGGNPASAGGVAKALLKLL
ncbi:hypothetical protein JCM10908_003874 [Rhodotorula pacifica]|uniref:type 1 glutamine amidotransferase domain-containing protein n=1 Tax=Rhodotorula pacifica TaxID=1495444 RepID=UPI003175DF74